MSRSPAPDAAPIDAALELLACPVCGLPLGRHDRTLRCASGHSYDLARQGYVNLLHGAAPANADTTEMVAARQRFLNTGAYQPIRDAVVGACCAATRVAEVGAGTGYYLSAVVAEQRPPAHLALDVSVAAVRRSSRLGLASAVADTWAGLPVLSGRLDRVLCIFAPRNPAEFARVLSQGGRVVVVTPRPGHLAELRARLHLLDVPPDKLARLDASFADVGLVPVGRTEIDFGLEMSPPTAADLVAMGPNAFHGEHAVLDEAVAVQVSVTVSSYQHL